jgi:hypothetical protein
MIWPVIWTPEAEADLLTAHFETAAQVGEAVRRWAETGDGFTEPFEGDMICVLAPGGVAIVRLDVTRGAIVLRVAPDQPLPFVAPLLDEPDDGDDA